MLRFSSSASGSSTSVLAAEFGDLPPIDDHRRILTMDRAIDGVEMVEEDGDDERMNKKPKNSQEIVASSPISSRPSAHSRPITMLMASGAAAAAISGSVPTATSSLSSIVELTESEGASSFEDNAFVGATSVSTGSHSTVAFTQHASEIHITPYRTTISRRTQSSSILEYGHQMVLNSPAFPHIEPINYALPAVERPQIDSQAFRSIAAATLADLMRSVGDQFSSRYLLVDCRYPYEFKGGHIRGAINVWEPRLIETYFFPTNQKEIDEAVAAGVTQDSVPIFYCEFSQKRGPRTAQVLRSRDRRTNELRYPALDHPEIYLLDRGYKQFFESGLFADLLETSETPETSADDDAVVPNGYIAMSDPRFQKELRGFTEHHRHHHGKKSRQSSRRALANKINRQR